MMMQLRMMSHNVKGLNDPTTLQKLWLCYKEQTPTLDILLLQEHNLGDEKVKNISFNLWKGASYLFTKVALGYFQQMEKLSKRGVYTLISDSLARLLLKVGS